MVLRRLEVIKQRQVHDFFDVSSKCPVEWLGQQHRGDRDMTQAGILLMKMTEELLKVDLCYTLLLLHINSAHELLDLVEQMVALLDHVLVLRILLVRPDGLDDVPDLR
jgi:hypothetical protein